MLEKNREGRERIKPRVLFLIFEKGSRPKGPNYLNYIIFNSLSENRKILKK